MSDSPPSSARATQSRPTISESSAWKYCLEYVAISTFVGKTLLNGLLGIPCVCSVDPDFVNLCGIVAQIFDMAQDVAPSILTDEVA